MHAGGERKKISVKTAPNKLIEPGDSFLITLGYVTMYMDILNIIIISKYSKTIYSISCLHNLVDYYSYNL